MAQIVLDHVEKAYTGGVKAINDEHGHPMGDAVLVDLIELDGTLHAVTAGRPGIRVHTVGSAEDAAEYLRALRAAGPGTAPAAPAGSVPERSPALAAAAPRR